MADINLLPEEFRAKDSKDREDAKKKPSKVELQFTSPEKSKDVSTKKGFWNKIFPGMGDVRVPKKNMEHQVHIAPAQKKVPHPAATEITMHEPEKTAAADDDSKPISLDDIETMDAPKTKQPLVNPHMSDFKPAETDVQAEKPDREVKMHMPSMGNAGQMPSMSDDKPKITLDTEADMDEKKSSPLGMVLAPFGRIKELFARRRHSHGIAVDLMPAKRLSLKDVNWSRIIRMLLISIGGAAIITFSWYLVLLDRERQGQIEFSDLQNEIVRLKGSILQLRDEQKEALLLKNKLDIAGALLDNHIYWSQFLSMLESHTLDGVYYDGLTTSLDETGIIALSGRADSLETVYWQRETFEASDAIVSVTVVDAVSSGTGAQSDVAFTFALEVDPMVWHK